jgi:CPA2 family monovalent cation:H+ antiporter-2
VVLTRVLSDNNELHTPTGHIAVGWLVVEDIFTVLVLVLLPALFGGQGIEAVPRAVGLAVLKMGALVVLALPLGGRVIPWLLARVADTGSRELFTLTVLVVALGIAVGSAVLFGVSMALGAFLAGMVVARSDFSVRAAVDALPMRDAFAVLFFVSAGMLFNPSFVAEAPGAVLATLGVVMVGKPLAALSLVLLLGYPVRAALVVAVALAQVGEFSFILAALGSSLGVLPAAATNALIGAAIVSISLNPLLFRLVCPTERYIARRPWLAKLLNARVRQISRAGSGPEPDVDPRYRAVVVGYGPVGQTVVRLLRENEIVPTVVEMNLDVVRRLRAEGVPAVYGDANHPETLKEAGQAQAATLVLAASGMGTAEEAIRAAHELNPDVRILARSAYLRERASMRGLGVDVVFSGEGEVALAMAEAILTGLGATPGQIDRERERVRADLFGTPEPEVPVEIPAASDGPADGPPEPVSDGTGTSTS